MLVVLGARAVSTRANRLVRFTKNQNILSSMQRSEKARLTHRSRIVKFANATWRHHGTIADTCKMPIAIKTDNVQSVINFSILSAVCKRTLIANTAEKLVENPIVVVFVNKSSSIWTIVSVTWRRNMLSAPCNE